MPRLFDIILRPEILDEATNDIKKGPSFLENMTTIPSLFDVILSPEILQDNKTEDKTKQFDYSINALIEKYRGKLNFQ